MVSDEWTDSSSLSAVPAKNFSFFVSSNLKIVVLWYLNLKICNKLFPSMLLSAACLVAQSAHLGSKVFFVKLWNCNNEQFIEHGIIIMMSNDSEVLFVKLWYACYHYFVKLSLYVIWKYKSMHCAFSIMHMLQKQIKFSLLPNGGRGRGLRG